MVLLLAGLMVAGCGSAPTASPAATVGSAPTPPPRLSDPTTAPDVFRALRVAGLTLVGTDSVAGVAATDPVERINATLAGQPLAILGYASDLGRAKLYPFRDGTAPDAGQPVFTFAGTNIVVEFGPSTTGKKPPLPDATLSATAQRLADTLQALLGQLSERSVQRASTPPPTPTPTLPPSSPLPSST